MMKFFQDTQLMFVNQVKHTFKKPVLIFVELFQPLMYLLLYMPLLNGLSGNLGGGSTAEVFIPGLLVMQAIFGCGFAGFTLIDDIRSGVIQRYLVTPVSRSAILLGMVLRDVVVLLLQCVLITVVAIPFGLEVNIGGFALSLLLYALIGATMASVSYAFSLIYKAEDALAPTMNTLTLPISLLSGIILPLALAPVWLQYVSKLDPFSYGVDAARALFTGTLNLNVAGSFLIVGALAVVVFYWSLMTLNKMTK